MKYFNQLGKRVAVFCAATLGILIAIPTANAQCQRKLDPLLERVDPVTHAGRLVIRERRGRVRPLMHDCYVTPQLFSRSVVRLGVVNYRPLIGLQEGATEDRIDHLGVQITRVRATQQDDKLNVSRNENWIDKGGPLPFIDSMPARTTVMAWNKAHSVEIINLTDANKIIGQVWHAQPGQHAASSWDYRKQWRIDQPPSEVEQLIVANLLLRFTVNPSASRQSIIPFHSTVFPETNEIIVRHYTGANQVGLKVRFCRTSCE